MEGGLRDINTLKFGNSKHIELLDLARFLAALIVALGHILYFTPFVADDAKLSLLFMPFHTGSTAVNYFFSLSGFVLILQLDRCDSGMRWIASRLIRLMPLLWVGLILGLTVEFLQTGNIQSTDTGLILSILGIQALFREYLLNINQPLWSLSVEIILSPVIFLIHKIQKTTLGLPLMFLVSIAVIEFFNNSALCMAIPFFIIGALCARVRIEISSKIANSILLILVLTYPITAKYIYLMGNSTIWVIAKCAAFFILLNLLLSGKPNRLVRDIGVFLGKRTFALYVVHYPLSALLRDLIEIQSFSNLLTFVSISIVVTGVFTEICYRFVDNFAIKKARLILYPTIK